MVPTACLFDAGLIADHFHVYSAGLRSKSMDSSQGVAPFGLAVLTAIDSSFAIVWVRADKWRPHSPQPPPSALVSSLLLSHLFPSSFYRWVHLFLLSCYRNDEKWNQPQRAIKTDIHSPFSYVMNLSQVVGWWYVIVTDQLPYLSPTPALWPSTIWGSEQPSSSTQGGNEGISAYAIFAQLGENHYLARCWWVVSAVHHTL